jgi:bile acid-coenzyme A ligase
MATERLAQLRAEAGDATAVAFIDEGGTERAISWSQLHSDACRAAYALHDSGVDEASVVVVALPNGPDHLTVTYAAWMLGACVLPLSHRTPRAELDGIAAVAASWRRPFLVTTPFPDDNRSIGEPLPHRRPTSDVAIASGGTTGTPKITVNDGDASRLFVGGRLQLSPLQTALGLEVGHTQLVCTPMYHASGFAWSHAALAAGNRLVLFKRFDAELVLAAVERHGVNHSMVVPEIMRRLLDAPGFAGRDLTSWVAFAHGGAPCPGWLKRAWLERLGAEHVYEGLGATEAIGATVVRGDDWLQRPGTVGRAVDCDVRILDETQRPVASGVVGDIYMRPAGRTAVGFSYVGADVPQKTADGFVSLGDVGWMDDDGFVFMADRRRDVIISGGANVYPAEVEAALSEHPLVRDVAVVGVDDPAWGERVHAVIVPTDPTAPPDVSALDAHCRTRLTSYKVPKSYSLDNRLSRTELGKLRRRDVRPGVEIARPDEIDDDRLLTLMDEGLRSAYLALPELDLRDGPNALRLLHQQIRARLGPPKLPPDVSVSSRDAAGDVPPLRIYEPAERRVAHAGVLWIHGGGMVAGAASDNDWECAAIATRLGCAVVSVDYRLAPDHAYPAALEDCYAALVHVLAPEFPVGIEPGQLVVSGASAGGNLALGLAMLARDRGVEGISSLVVHYPMLDDTGARSSMARFTASRAWHRDANRAAWAAYLGDRKDVPAYAAPGRATVAQLRGLPPTFLDIGSLDGFLDEVVDFAGRLAAADVAVELVVTPEAFHGSESMAPKAGSSRRMLAARWRARERAVSGHL